MAVYTNAFRARLCHLSEIRAMATTPKQMEIEHPQFFVTQSERLAALLDAVVAESSTATNPDACIDYLEITEILVELLDQSQYLSVLSSSQIGERWQEVQSLMSKVETIEEAVADWDTRTKVRSEPNPMEANTMTNLSRKRTRSMDSDVNSQEISKRLRGTEIEGAVEPNAELDIEHKSICPSIERPQAAWWTEPFYD